MVCVGCISATHNNKKIRWRRTQMKHRMRDGGRAQGRFIINEKSNTHTCPLVTGSCSGDTDPVVGSGVPHSPTTSSAACSLTQFVLRELPYMIKSHNLKTLTQEIVH